MKNNCKYDEECRFSHDSEIVAKAQQARSERTREKSHHRQEKNDRSSGSQQFRVNICLFWRQGRCRYGNSCRFAHVGPMYPAHMGYAMHPAYTPTFFAPHHPGGGAAMAYAHHPQTAPGVNLVDPQSPLGSMDSFTRATYAIDGSAIPIEAQRVPVMLAPVRYY